MAYNAVAQVDDFNDAASHSSDSDDASSHAPGSPVALEPPLESRSAHDEPVGAVAPLTSLINRTLKPDSSLREYEMVEDDDYEAEEGKKEDPTAAAAAAAATVAVDPSLISPATIPAPTKTIPPATLNDAPATQVSIVDAVSHSDIPTSTSPDPLVRTPSVSSVIDLRHPTPDLQSLQGAYVGNIERLESSAERLSMTSSDLGVELRKLDMEQKRRSSASSTQQGPESPSRQFSPGSVSNSIIGLNSAARSGGYSPGAFVTSPKGSIISGSRLRSTSLSSPLHEIHEQKTSENVQQREIETEHQGTNALLSYEPPTVDLPNFESQNRELQTAEPVNDVMERPLTARSTDTYRQATDLFLDFDGVHFVPHPRDSGHAQPPSVNRTQRPPAGQHFDKPQPGQDLIFYPAPIPKVLNLPQRLSKRPPVSDHEKRRTQILNNISTADKKDGDATNNTPGKRASAIPPQLRASAFFDRPSAPLDVKIKNKSVVDTLESILDASAHAPVTAFVDHPIVGSAGREVYSSVQKKRSSRMLGEKGDRRSRHSLHPRDNGQNSLGPVHSDVEDNEGRALHDSHSDSGHSRSDSSDTSTSDSSSDENESEEEFDTIEEEKDYDESQYTGRPTTLLAELQRRKQELKQRNRTAATSFPNGLHSTLLQLDAVAQAQSHKRRQTRVTLAWDTEAANGADDADDEDVPLGVLYANKNPALEERPLGLMERRELEENEPLSRRRARLRGEAPEPLPNKRSSAMLRVPPAEPDSEDEGETLAQRLRRLKAEKADKSKSIISTEFENEIMAELGKLHEPVDPPEPATKKTQAPSKPQEPAAEEEETLGQRRKRLQAEARIRKTQSTTDMNARRSMADILQAYPSQHAYGPSLDHTQSARNLGSGYQHNRVSTMYSLPPSMVYHAGPGQVPGFDPQGSHGNHPYNMSFMPNAQIGMNVGVAPGLPHLQSMPPRNQPNIDPRQRDVIDRWRQSISGV